MTKRCFTIGYYSEEYNDFLKKNKMFSPHNWKREVYFNVEALLSRINEISENIKVADDFNMRGHPVSYVKDDNNNFKYSENMEVKKELWDLSRVNEMDSIDFIAYDEDCKYFQYWVEKGEAF